jgi:hypothetical protein
MYEINMASEDAQFSAVFRKIVTFQANNRQFLTLPKGVGAFIPIGPVFA